MKIWYDKNSTFNVKQRRIYLNAIRFQSVNKIIFLVVRTFLSENCYTLFVTLGLLFSIRTCKTELYKSKECDAKEH